MSLFIFVELEGNGPLICCCIFSVSGVVKDSKDVGGGGRKSDTLSKRSLMMASSFRLSSWSISIESWDMSILFSLFILANTFCIGGGVENREYSPTDAGDWKSQVETCSVPRDIEREGSCKPGAGMKGRVPGVFIAMLPFMGIVFMPKE